VKLGQADQLIVKNLLESVRVPDFATFEHNLNLVSDFKFSSYTCFYFSDSDWGYKWVCKCAIVPLAKQQVEVTVHSAVVFSWLSSDARAVAGLFGLSTEQ